MNNINCSVVKDLMPLYIDELTSEETSKLIKEHIDSCNECKEFYELCKSEFKLPTQKADKKDRKIITKMRLMYLWYMFWPMLYGIACQFGWIETIFPLFFNIFAVISSLTAYMLMDVSFDPEKRKEYYEKENEKIKTNKGSTILQIIFIAFPIFVPVIFMLIAQM